MLDFLPADFCLFVSEMSFSLIHWVSLVFFLSKNINAPSFYQILLISLQPKKLYQTSNLKSMREKANRNKKV